MKRLLLVIGIAFLGSCAETRDPVYDAGEFQAAHSVAIWIREGKVPGLTPSISGAQVRNELISKGKTGTIIFRAFSEGGGYLVVASIPQDAINGLYIVSYAELTRPDFYEERQRISVHISQAGANYTPKFISSHKVDNGLTFSVEN